MNDNSLEAALLRHRPRLMKVAYRMMGTLDDAEDVVQDTYLRVRSADSQSIDQPERYLVRAVVRQCIDRWRSARARRETYVGPWLPEPVVEDPQASASQHIELAESLSFALLVLLESLNPVERAVYLLHDVFGYDFAEVATIVDRSADNCRQIARRARLQLQGGPPRYEPTPDEQHKLVRQFIDVCESGDVANLANMLAQDVRLHSDGGGRVTAARAPIVGHDHVLRFLVGIRGKAQKLGHQTSMRVVLVNGQPGIMLRIDGQLHSIWALEFAQQQIQRIYIVLNPDKLGTCQLNDDTPQEEH